MKKYSVFFVLISLITSCYQGQTADLVIHNAKIYSCDGNFTIYEAMAIKDGKILQLGPEREILNGYDCDNIIDAELQTIYPGFYDAHCHFLSYAKTLKDVNLVDLKSFNEVVKRIDYHYKTYGKEKWITGRGWDQTLWENDSIFPTNEILNKKFPETPILIKRIDGHAALVNQKALDLAGITINTKINGGIVQESNGKLTGILIDNAIDLVTKIIPEWSKNDKKTFLKQAEYKLFEQGLTSINDAGVYQNDRDLFIEMYLNNELKIHNYLMLYPEEDNLKFASTKGIYNKGKLHIGSFKIVADGALGSWGACLSQPYSDNVHKNGYLLKSVNEIKEIASLAKEINYQLNSHCIGDSANNIMLKIYAEIIQDKYDHRWKIEHAQVLLPQDFNYFQTIGVIPSVQPTHCTSDMRWATERLGHERIKFAYAYNDILKNAGLIALGTDFPIENISTIETFYAAISRKNKEGQPKNGFLKENALSRKNTLMGMTYWAAYSNFEENERGSLEAGKNADFIFMSNDLMTIDESQILNTFVLRTFIDGQEVFNANE